MTESQSGHSSVTAKRSFRLRRLCVLFALLIASFSITHAGSQITTPYPLAQRPAGPLDEQDPVFIARRNKALNIQRQRSMVSDADRLVQLARELNDEISKNGSAALTPVQLRKIADIEKLAHNVKEKMSYPVSAEPPYDPFNPQIGQPLSPPMQ